MGSKSSRDEWCQVFLGSDLTCLSFQRLLTTKQEGYGQPLDPQVVRLKISQLGSPSMDSIRILLVCLYASRNIEPLVTKMKETLCLDRRPM